MTLKSYRVQLVGPYDNTMHTWVQATNEKDAMMAVELLVRANTRESWQAVSATPKS